MSLVKLLQCHGGGVVVFVGNGAVVAVFDISVFNLSVAVISIVCVVGGDGVIVSLFEDVAVTGLIVVGDGDAVGRVVGDGDLIDGNWRPVGV